MTTKSGIHLFDQKVKGFKEITWIPVKNISVVWAQAQRPLLEAHVDRIADNFDPEMFGTIAVTKPNGHGIYHAIDGQHRTRAVEKRWGGEEKVPCQVFDAEDPARAAELFDSMNSQRKSLQPIDLFRVRVTAGSEIEVEVNKIVKRCGYVISSPGGKGTNALGNSITCVAALKSVYLGYGSEVLENTLNLIKAIWGFDKSSVSAHIVRGIAEFLAEYRSLDWTRLRENMAAKYTPARLMGAARTAREINGGSFPNAIKQQLVSTYNDGLRSDKKRLKPSGLRADG